MKRAFNLESWISKAGQAVSRVGVNVGMALGEVTQTSSPSAMAGPAVVSGSGAEVTSSKPKIYVRVSGSEETHRSPIWVM